MDGLSVKEAANILGVPKGRVWELIARGVLVGTPESGGMRVYLHGKHAEVVPAQRVDDKEERPHRTNGNGGNGGSVHEGSPFREILTEFRNLTERYGQALLALGEARGEVAALRSRVELLEARIDLRLPPAPPFVSWSPPQEAPGTPEPAAEPSRAEASVQAEAETQPVAADAASAPGPVETSASEEEPEEDAEPRTRERPRIRPRHRRRPSRRVAMEGIALALARAEDPSAAELPRADEPNPAYAAYRVSIADAASAGVADEEPDQVVATGAVATSEPIADAFLGDDALGGLVTDAEAATTEPSMVAPPLVDEPAHEELGIEAMSSRHEAPPAPEQAVETPIYISEWDEPDWIAEEDLDSWDMAPPQPAVAEQSATSGPIAPTDREADAGVPTEALVDLPVEVGASAAPPEPPTTADQGSEAAGEFVADAIEDAFSEPAPGATEASPEEHAPEQQPSAPLEEPASFVTSAMEDAWSEGTSAEPARDESTVDVAPSPEQLAGDETAAEPEPMNALAEEEIFPTDPTEVMSALVESGAALPASEPMVVEAAEQAEPMEDAGQTDVEPTADTVADAPSAEAPLPEAPSSAATSADAGEEELMWLGDEFAPESERDWGATAASAAPITPAEDRALNRLAAERGWDDGELEAIRSLLAPPATSPLEAAEDESPSPVPQQAAVQPQEAEPPAPDVGPGLPFGAEPDDLDPEDEVMDWEQSPTAWTPPAGATPSFELPGALELDEALAAVSRPRTPSSPAQIDVPPAAATATSPTDAAPVPPGAASNAEDQAPRSWSKPPTTAGIAPADREVSPPDASVDDEDWLAGRRGPAANAYRRLRRLFPR